MLSYCGAGEDSWESLGLSVNSKENQLWIFIGRTDAKAEAPICWPLDAKSQLIGKDPDAGKDWRQKEKGKAEDKMVRLHHWLSGHEFEQTPRDSEGQESLACCSLWGVKEPDTTEQLSNIPLCEYTTLGLSIHVGRYLVWFQFFVFFLIWWLGPWWTSAYVFL